MQIPSSTELSNTLVGVLKDAFTENLPPELITVLNFLKPQNPDDPNFLVSDKSFQDLLPLFFSSNPNENFPNTIGKYVDFLTTSSEVNILAADNLSVKVIWGRHGGDFLVGYDPSVEHGNSVKIDVFTGDYTDEKIFGALRGVSAANTRSEWKDTFILGDWKQPYYVESDSGLGLNQFALITDFNSSQDVIQLHGTSDDYELVETDLGTAIFWRKDDGYDLVGLVGKTSNLDLEEDYFLFKGDQPPEEAVLENSQQIGTAGIDFVFSSTTDAQGNLYIGGGTGGSLAGPTLGGRDAWLAKYDSSGTQQWSQQFGTGGIETAWALASDGNNLYVTGNTSGVLDGSTKGGNDAYLAKYDSDGNQQWVKQFGTLTFDEAFRLSADSSGNVYVGGHTIGGLVGQNKNVGQDFVTNFSFPSTDSFVVKFDSDGNQLWASQFGTVELDDNWGMTSDRFGNVFAGGNTRGNLGGQNAGFYDNWLVKLDSTDGQVQWTKQFGTSDYDFLWDLETDNAGNVFATGYTLGDLGGKNAGASDVYLAKFDSAGNQQWIKQFGTLGDDAPFYDALDIDANGDIYLTGYTDGDLGDDNSGSFDAWVAKYDTDGNQLWLQQFGTSSYDTSTTVSVDNFGHVYVSGITDGSLGGLNAGSYDAWLVKLNAGDGTIEDFSGTTFSDEDDYTELAQLYEDSSSYGEGSETGSNTLDAALFAYALAGGGLDSSSNNLTGNSALVNSSQNQSV